MDKMNRYILKVKVQYTDRNKVPNDTKLEVV